jgi:glycosyltransferase involved in cell wall biosynthesis
MTTTPAGGTAPSRRTLVVSAVNLVEGGTLKVLKDCVEIAASTLPDWRIVVLAHRRELVPTAGVEVLEMPHIKPRWWRRLWAEWHQFNALSAQLKPDLWLSLHDLTPRVQARRQVVYCHNPAPFWRPSWRDAWYGPDYWLFAKFYGLMYRAFIQRNAAVVVQQAWLRDEFQRRWNAPNVIVARPEMPGAKRSTATPARIPATGSTFIYPALPRCFKNFEIIGEALERLEADAQWQGEVRWTLSGTENRYARWLKRRFGHLKSLRWIGLQTREQMQQQYRECQCLIFPSRLETWGLPITEAKELGLGVLAADLPYAHETVGDCAFVDFFDPLDAQGLADRMLAFSQGRSTLRAVEAAPVAEPFVSDWPALLARLTQGL